MLGICLKIYVSEARRQDGKLLYEWLLEQAKALGIKGGTVIRAIDGYGRHGRLHEETFFELAGELPVAVEFLLDEAQCESLLALLRTRKLKLFYVKMAAEFGISQ